MNFEHCRNAPHLLIVTILFVLTLFVHSHDIFAQSNQVIQVKAFSEDLTVYPNLSLSINKGEFVNLNDKGMVFVNLKSSDLPVQSIKPRDESLEAASWNLSKGVLEVIIRKKSYIDKPIKIISSNGSGIEGIEVQFRGDKSISKQTNSAGIISIPLGLNEKIKSPDQFKIPGYDILKFSNEELVLISVEKITSKVEAAPQIVEKQSNQNRAKKETGSSFLQIDTINSLRSFYNLLNTIQRENLSQNDQLQLDQKFDELLTNITKGNNADSIDLLAQISDTTIVENDINKIFQQVMKDNTSMSKQRLALEEKIQMVIDKLNAGFENMSEESKENLLDDIEELESTLRNNKNELNENLNNYLRVINELKRRFFDLQELESRLSESERERKKEREIYRQRLLITLGIVLLFAFLIILLFYFRSRLKRQKAALIEANKVVKLTNENLENIVFERTFLLHKTFKELDTVLYKASHDLRAPLSSIAGISDLIKRETNNNELTGLLFKTNKRMDKLLKKLSTVSEIHQPGEFEQFDINIISNQVIASFSQTIRERGIKFTSNIDAQDKVLSIPKLFEVILFHLLENALFFSWIDNEKTGEVDLKVSIQNDNIEISVTDNGMVIDNSIKFKIFEMFYVGSEYSDGNGLGLYIVQKSAELLNGTVEVNTNSQGGTRFIVKLPTDGKGSNTLEFLSSLNV
ncbi:sensor histidine kinase [Marivirga sericea]|uniref:sensor histidine kinase n=1 Tax=Marivirga sericea TaxID=1028 RepID=UPI001594DC48|nr:HAMP domain-containing sensor histidine kinase [Marivirga sericea]